MPAKIPRTEDGIRSIVRIDGESGCWEWLGALKNNVPGRVPSPMLGGKSARTQVYEVFVGAIPEDENGVSFYVVMTCANSLCVCPDHMTIKDKTFVLSERATKLATKLAGDADFCAARDARLKALHQDEDFKSRTREIGRRAMKKLHTNPEFQRAAKERGRASGAKRKARLDADPVAMKDARDHMMRVRADATAMARQAEAISSKEVREKMSLSAKRRARKKVAKP